jgi:tRNA(fMet)-specific endonuclease VapC
VSLKFLLDTNIVSEPLRPEPHHGILRRLQRHEEEIAIPSVVWHELRFGMERLPPSRRRDAIERYLDEVVLTTMPILDYDRAAAEWHATERARLATRGETPPFVDGQIAAIAHVHDLTLVTLNDADFRRFHGLRVLPWHH